MQKVLDPWKHNGIDRVDSSKGYTLDNCVPCCSKCNYAKHEMSVEEFKEYITNVYQKLILKGSSTIPEGSTSEAIADGNGMHPNKDEDIVTSIQKYIAVINAYNVANYMEGKCKSSGKS